MKKLLLTAGIAATAALGLSTSAMAATVTPAHTATVTPAVSGWTQVYIHAADGNGCASMDLTPGGDFEELNGFELASEPCSEANWWYARTLATGADEFVTPDFDYAFSWSPTGSWELQVPNSNKTVLWRLNSGAWFPLANQPQSAGLYPEGAGVQLGAPPLKDTTQPPDAWDFCGLSDPTCVPVIT